MTVKRMMKKNPITTTAETSIVDVADILKENHIHRLPVLDKKGKLIGVITEKDILHASPSPVSSLSVYEMPYMLSRLKVSNLMTKDVRTIDPDTTVEEAAKIMVDDDLSCLPVIEGEKLVGIVSKSDMFKVLYELFGSLVKGTRVTFLFNQRSGEISRLSTALANKGFDIISIGTFVDKGEKDGVLTTIKVRTENSEGVLEVLRPIVKEILDVRVV
ncbi:MAG: CBS domain-containing protein [Sphaerochaetaceae bacterium]|nr:CBS domain-containing protein [Spirochaetales bacterium]MDY3768108.1 CBS domain-containing protein [Sphaerochaetaceae bacterium]MDY5968230.1 CBS domain-containing protein [Sphaerochaetaceae bacterium]